MGKLGCGCSVIAILLAAVTVIPFLGWGNWFATLPVAVLAIIFSALGILNGEQRVPAILGLIAGVCVMFFALFRLLIGGGVL